MAFEGSLGSTIGGQQACTRELIEVLEKAEFDLVQVPIENRLRLLDRVRNRIRPISYPVFWPSDTADLIARKAKESVAGIIFFNLIDFLPLARQVRPKTDVKTKLVMLSHGLASPDVRHINRIVREMPEIIGRCPRYNLQAVLKKERDYLGDFDQVISLAEFEADLCREMGARRSDWIPRVIPEQPLEWRPVEGRLGFVGTLDHPPSMEGMVKVLEAWPRDAGSGVRVRVVSRSRWHGEWLARRFSQVEYLGPLDGGEMENEAASWCAFLHPMFCFARGCSTKLVTGLGWRIPCLSTASGIRGYELPPGSVVMADSPSEFAAECLRVAKSKAAAKARANLIATSNRLPVLGGLASRLRTLIET